jgi:hypothetical protein
MVLSLTLEGRGGVKTARSYPLLALESSFSTGFSLYRIKGVFSYTVHTTHHALSLRLTGLGKTMIDRWLMALEHYWTPLNA